LGLQLEPISSKQYPTFKDRINEECFHSIVLVHGLGGHALTTWEAKTANGMKKNWVVDPDFLQSALPSGRIFTYGYNANIFGDKVVSRVEEHAEGLRAGLLTFRRSCKV
jgi:hypothetical protein